MSEPARLPRVAIVGRPNVGKSTLFNRLVGRRLAIVDDTPGVTRDRREGEARLADLNFLVFDTAGLETATDESLEGRMRKQTERAIADADVILFLVDARAGITPTDEAFGRLLRRTNRPVILAANKAESRESRLAVVDAFSLGLGEPIPLSAEHGEGLPDLRDALAAHFVPTGPAADGGAADAEDEAPFDPEAPETDDPLRPLRIAVIGRPNAGKSSLINRLVGDDRLITGPEAGLTRDAIAVPWLWDGRPVRLWDTAGLRRKARVETKLERLSAADTLRAVRFAEAVVLLIDGTVGLDRQDLVIAGNTLDEGRALVVAVNKWDAVEDRKAVLQAIQDRLETSLTQVKGVPVITLSAMTGRGLDGLMPAVRAVLAKWNRRVPTAPLNRWLTAAVERHPAPAVEGRRLRPRYMTQIKTRPPTFALFMNRPGALPESYLRYLANSLRESFDMAGVPVRLVLRKSSDNPYTDGG